MLNKKLLGSVSSLPSDENFENVTLLLSGDGTNGAQNNTFLDSSTNNFTITRNGNTTQGSFSPYGNLWSNYFSSSSLRSAASSALAVGSGNFTMEAWIFVTSTGLTDNWIMSLSLDVRLRIGSTDKLEFYDGVNNISIKSTGSLTANTWNHVAVVRSGTGSNQVKLYINGVNDGTGTCATNFNNATYTGDVGNAIGFSLFFPGYISNVRVTKSAVYTANFTPSTTPLTAIANCVYLTCQSNRFIDNSASGLAITVNGTPSVQRFSPFNPTAPYDTATIGGSGYFDGSGDYLTTPTSGQFAPTGDFTVGIWVYPLSLAAASAVVGNYTSNVSTDWVIDITTAGAVRYYTNGATVRITSATGAVKINQWNYISLSRSGTTLTGYVNGTSAGTYTQATTFGSSSKTIYIGIQSGSAEPLTGYLSDVKLIDGSAVTTVPTVPQTATTGTNLLLNMTNAGIPDLAMINNLETVGNAQVSTSVKKYGTGSLAFDGTGDNLKFRTPQPFIFGTGNFTVEGWVYFNSVATAVLIGDVNNSTGASVWSVLFNSSTNVLRLTCNASTAYSFSWTPSATTWFHFAICRSGTSLRAFINGTQIGTTQTSSDNISSANGSGNFYLGSTNDGALQLNGNLDDIRVSNVARYTANFTPPASALPSF